MKVAVTFYGGASEEHQPVYFTKLAGPSKCVSFTSLDFVQQKNSKLCFFSPLLVDCADLNLFVYIFR